MITVPPTLPPKRVEKSYVAERNPHHEKNKKDNEENQESEDEISLSSKEEKKKQEKPINPMQGHIDIDV